MYSVFLKKAKFLPQKWADTKGTVLRKIILYTVEGDMILCGRAAQTTSGHLQWGDGVRDQVSGDGRAPKDPHQLHQWDSSDSQRNECVCWSDQLCEMQQHPTTEMEAEWAVVPRRSGTVLSRGGSPWNPSPLTISRSWTLAWAGVSTVVRSWRSSRASRRARGRGVHSWPRVPREPTTTGLEDSGAQVCRTWPQRVWLMPWGIIWCQCTGWLDQPQQWRCWCCSWWASWGCCWTSWSGCLRLRGSEAADGGWWEPSGAIEEVDGPLAPKMQLKNLDRLVN